MTFTGNYYVCASPFEEGAGFCLTAITYASDIDEAQDNLNHLLRKKGLRLESDDEIHELTFNDITSGFLLLSDELEENLSMRSQSEFERSSSEWPPRQEDRAEQYPPELDLPPIEMLHQKGKTILQQAREAHPGALDHTAPPIQEEIWSSTASGPAPDPVPEEVIAILRNYEGYPYPITPADEAYIWKDLPPSDRHDITASTELSFGNLILIPDQTTNKAIKVIGRHNLNLIASTSLLKDSVNIYVKRDTKAPAYVLFSKQTFSSCARKFATNELFYTQID